MMLWGKTWDVALLQSKSAKEADLEFLCENAPKFAASWFAKNKRGELQNSVLEARAGAIHMHTALEQEGFERIWWLLAEENFPFENPRNVSILAYLTGSPLLEETSWETSVAISPLE